MMRCDWFGRRAAVLCLAVACSASVVSVASIALAAGRNDMPHPDFTRGDPIPADANHDWNLGPTGMRGWMYSDSLVTSDARQVRVTQVAPGSPAEGVMRVGDVILGVAGERFSYDPRIEIGRAITLAETKAGKGELLVTRWRDGNTQDVALQIDVLGSYGPTAPYDCDKSELIYQRGCEALARKMAEPGYSPNAIVRSLNAMALLSSKDNRYAKLLRREAKWASAFSSDSFQTWWYGYCITFLSEYVMLTRDKSVMPGLKRLVGEAIRGQSIVGSWGHRFANPDGRLGGYGMMNAPGLPLTISLALAREAGVKHPGLDLAITRSADLLRFYAGKGSVPYGDHDPWVQTHDDNGKNGMAAVLFTLLNEPKPAEYFSRMSVATHGPARDTGHTGNFWNMIWAMPSVGMSGKHATGAWMKEFGGWYYDLSRTHDGGFIHQGPPQKRNDATHQWDATGAYLLALGMPRNTLRMTSDQHRVAPQITPEQAQGLIEDGRGWNQRDRIDYLKDRSNKELVKMLQSWSPVLRERAGQALSRRTIDLTATYVDMLRSDDLYTRLGACQGLKYQRQVGGQAIVALARTLEADDLWLRILAAEALGRIGGSARNAAPTMLKMMTEHDVENDPRNMQQRYFTNALFSRRDGLLRNSLAGVDRRMLFEAIRAGLQNQDGRSRSAIGTVYDQLTLQELEPILPAIHEAIVTPSPSGIMFADGIRMAGLELFARHRIDEGIELLAMYARDMKQHGSQKRIVPVMEMLKSYGKHAQRVLPHLEETLIHFMDEPGFPQWARDEKSAAMRAAIEEIRRATDEPRLVRINLAEKS